MTTLKIIRKHLLELDKAVAAGASADTLRATIACAVDLVDELQRDAKLPAASQLGRRGGTVTAQRGPDYFRELAARRKTHGGGRPRKDAV